LTPVLSHITLGIEKETVAFKHKFYVQHAFLARLIVVQTIKLE